MSARRTTLIIAGIEALYVTWTIALGYANDNPLGDGMNWMPAFFAVPAFIVTGLPALLLAALGKASRLALALAILGVFLVPLIYWQFLLAALLSIASP